MEKVQLLDLMKSNDFRGSFTKTFCENTFENKIGKMEIKESYYSIDFGWDISEPILSERDRGFINLADFVSPF